MVSNVTWAKYENGNLVCPDSSPAENKSAPPPMPSTNGYRKPQSYSKRNIYNTAEKASDIHPKNVITTVSPISPSPTSSQEMSWQLDHGWRHPLLHHCLHCRRPVGEGCIRQAPRVHLRQRGVEIRRLPRHSHGASPDGGVVHGAGRQARGVEVRRTDVDHTVGDGDVDRASLEQSRRVEVGLAGEQGRVPAADGDGGVDVRPAAYQRRARRNCRVDRAALHDGRRIHRRRPRQQSRGAARCRLVSEVRHVPAEHGATTDTACARHRDVAQCRDGRDGHRLKGHRLWLPLEQRRCGAAGGSRAVVAAGQTCRH
ncbi:hypothetical protein B0H67DRAFT_582387 [Lasiosphaeris hirsuta]|uniref:Uncharacterized protein n=1 Tax=Lasiosphaeris hirsuta TaxID=260670 RepID=A0AA40AHT4_9PEZI|nr:hypothetical protein B0H67DRAFT_582387 [Lasiosphaeris hirsuta]